ncbi:hypothetical protein [Membranihabitans marinus]
MLNQLIISKELNYINQDIYHSLRSDIEGITAMLIS